MTIAYLPMPMPGGAFAVSRRRNERRPPGFRCADAARITDWEAEGGALGREPKPGAEEGIGRFSCL